MRYLDTGGRDPEHSLYRWLENNLPGAASFACQSGYFSGDGIFPLEAHFKDLLDRGGDFHLVVGGNEGGVRSDDLAYVLDLFDGTAGTGDHSLTLVAADDVLMHPKTFLIGYPDGSFAALVGSVSIRRLVSTSADKSPLGLAGAPGVTPVAREPLPRQKPVGASRTNCNSEPPSVVSVWDLNPWACRTVAPASRVA